MSQLVLLLYCVAAVCTTLAVLAVCTTLAVLAVCTTDRHTTEDHTKQANTLSEINTIHHQLSNFEKQ